jgi:copper chaperone CopZ
MRRPAELFGLLIVAVAVLTAGCGRSQKFRASFTVEGMHCESCSSAITEALERVEGVESASADHGSGAAEAIFRSPEVSVDELTAEIEGLGYTVTRTDSAAVQG